MKCIMCLSGDHTEYEEMARVAVLSALTNTSLEVVLIYDGSNDNLKSWMKNLGVYVIDWTISFLEDLSQRYDGQKSIEFCRGTYLCMETPHVLTNNGLDDDYILYADIDCLFIGEIHLEGFHPKYFCAPKDWSITDNSRFSTGVILMNRKAMHKAYPYFLEHLKHYNYNFQDEDMGPCDQGAWNTFFLNKHDELPEIYDWKPWWGKSEEARIIHFSGPKPRQLQRLIEQKNFTSEVDRIHKYVVDQDPNAFLYYLNQWEGIARMT